MRCGNHQWMAALTCVVCCACGNRPEANEPKPTSNVEASESSESSEAPEDNSPKPAASGEKPSNPAIADICDKLCAKAAEKCTKQVAGLYRASCRRYKKTTDKCVAEITRALECQLKAADEPLCAHQADPNCSQVNQELKACEHGTAPIEQTKAEDLSLPAGWAKISDTQLGFTVAMPRGAALDSKNERRTWQAEESGITYIVAAIDPPAGKLNNPTILRTVIAYVGSRCQMRLKLHGQLEIKGTTVVQYDSGCPDGTEWHGMLHFWDGKAVSTGFHAPAGSKGITEPYYYSFAVGN